MKIISIGSNIDPDVHIPAAIKRLQSRMPVLKISPFTLTAPIDRPEQDDYWNGAVAVEWAGSREDLQVVLRQVEHLADRARSEDTYEARTLDLDIIWWHDWVDDDVLKRGFVRDAVLAIAPSAILPNGRKLADVPVLPHPAGEIVWEATQTP